MAAAARRRRGSERDTELRLKCAARKEIDRRALWNPRRFFVQIAAERRRFFPEIIIGRRFSHFQIRIYVYVCEREGVRGLCIRVNGKLEG